MRLEMLAFAVTLYICGCTRTYTEKDFADSKWEDYNGTIIVLYKSGICKIQDFKWNLIYPSTWMKDSVWMRKHPDSFVGNWMIKLNRHGEQEMHISINNSGYGVSMGIKDHNTIIYTIGDPDECEYYTLTRVPKL